MVGTPHLMAVAGVVRGLAVGFGMSLIVGFIALQGFDARYGGSAGDQRVGDIDAALASAVTEQASIGLLCRERPARTDTVLFQHAGQSSVVVLRLDQAIAAASAREGMIRRYCL